MRTESRLEALKEAIAEVKAHLNKPETIIITESIVQRWCRENGRVLVDEKSLLTEEESCTIQVGLADTFLKKDIKDIIKKLKTLTLELTRGHAPYNRATYIWHEEDE